VKPPIHHRNSGAQFTACGKDSWKEKLKCTSRKVKASCGGCVAALRFRGLREDKDANT
jgi:hypothetical protein